jgi:beta-lactamase regulating signal transducer with metallopeptidase domain
MERTKLGAVLAHERSHIQRHDPWVQLLSGIHRALLWGSPLSWFLDRRIVQSAEEASDDAAVAAIHDRAYYAETLLEFMQRGVWKSGFAGVSMARYGSPEKRIRRLLNSRALSRGVTGRSVATIAAVVSPLAWVIATAQARPQFEIADVHVSAAKSNSDARRRNPRRYVPDPECNHGRSD